MTDPARAAMPANPGAVSRGIALAFVACGLAVALFFQACLTAQANQCNYATFRQLRSLDHVVLIGAWSPRVGSLLLAEQFMRHSAGLSAVLTKVTGVRDVMAQGMALWTASWFMLICLVYLLAFRARALYYMFGTYACLSFGYMPGLENRLYAWDMPATFFFTLFMAMLVTRPAPAVLTLLIWAAVPFKETAVVLGIFPLFVCRQRHVLKRVGLAMAVVAGAVALKALLNFACLQTVSTLAVQSFTDDGLLFWQNLRALGHGLPLLINAGTLAAFLLVPPWRGIPLLFKLAAGLFIGGNFFFGVITEYRIWFELIPLALYNLEAAFLRARCTPHP